MRIKKYRNNEYVLAEDVWVRNLCSDVKPIDINSLGKNDLSLFLANECENMKVSSVSMDDMSRIDMDNVIIFSDGYAWEERQKVLAKIPSSDVKTIGVNGSLAKWNLVGDKAEFKRTMTFYFVNNPYDDCVRYVPRKHRYFPNLIASTKTNPKFIKEYAGQPMFYKSSQDLNYSGVGQDECMRLDDYRNPVCGAISFAWKNKVRKLALFCCDEAFEDERPGAVKMKNGLFQYPQQILCQKIIDKQIYWLRKAGVKVVDCSAGTEYENAGYINLENLASFFARD